MKRKTPCANGNTVERFYDRASRSSVTRTIDAEGNQIGEAHYTGNKATSAAVQKQLIRDNGGEKTP